MPRLFGDILYPLLGRASLVFDALRYGRSSPDGGGQLSAPRAPGLDGTGRVVHAARVMRVLWDADGVVYVEHDSFGHSFWRAQEFSLFREHGHLLQHPVLDFGCGDGSFGSIAIGKTDYGADIDAVALEIAHQFGVYQALLLVAGNRIPLQDETVRTVVSNSVLEHVRDLGAMIAEIHRILAIGGALIFTAPVKQYERDLVKYYGRAAADRVNAESTHLNLWEVDEWRAVLARHGFAIEVLRQYQGDTFTFWFRMFRLLGNQGLARFVPRIRDWAWGACSTRLIRMVRSSISETTTGGNIFVVARKTRGASAQTAG